MFDSFSHLFHHDNVCLLFVYIFVDLNNKLPPFDQILINWLRKMRNLFISALVAFKFTLYIFYYEIHLKYCQNTDVYRIIENLRSCTMSYPGAWERYNGVRKYVSPKLTDYFIHGMRKYVSPKLTDYFMHGVRKYVSRNLSNIWIINMLNKG